MNQVNILSVCEFVQYNPTDQREVHCVLPHSSSIDVITHVAFGETYRDTSVKTAWTEGTWIDRKMYLEFYVILIVVGWRAHGGLICLKRLQNCTRLFKCIKVIWETDRQKERETNNVIDRDREREGDEKSNVITSLNICRTKEDFLNITQKPYFLITWFGNPRNLRC